MSLFRSEEMKLFEVVIPKDNAWDIMNELGRLDCLHFIDLNHREQPHHLSYTLQVKRIEEAERRIEYLQEQCRLNGVISRSPKDVNHFITNMDKVIQIKRKAPQMIFEEIEADTKDKEKFLQD